MFQELIKNYLLRGFSLANRSLDVYLISIGLSSIGILANLFSGSLLGTLFQFASFISIFFAIGYGMSIPLFLTFKQQTKPLEFNNILNITLRNTKRLFLVIILFFVLLVILGILLLILTTTMTHPKTSQEMMQNFLNQINTLGNLNPFSIIVLSISSVFVFTPIYFSIENRGFFTSLKRSLNFSLKHLNFIVLVILIHIVNYFVTTKLPATNPLGLLVSIIINQYIAVIMVASELYFYQDHK